MIRSPLPQFNLIYVTAVSANESIWLTRKMMGTLQDVNVRTLNQHVKNIC